MNRDKYKYSSDNQHLIFSFFSIGKQGVITKVVVYEEIEDGMYNLAFGDYNYLIGEIDDKAISNNGDTIKVLATVIETIKDFFVYKPESVIFIQGSTSNRTKLYAKIIRDNLSEIETEYQILALETESTSLDIPDFKKEYSKFVILKKQNP
ncbi:MAG: hypothetical protein NW226_24305 [Microscillaceae bacterium]|nr:hypothetical protein [Microscillaceae bacterium]